MRKRSSGPILPERAGSGKKLQDFGPGRVCAHGGCRTVLSRYNSGPTCTLHTYARGGSGR